MPLKGQIPCGFLVLKARVQRDEALIAKEIVELVRTEIGPVAAFKTEMVVKRLPKTRSARSFAAPCRKLPMVSLENASNNR